MMKEGLEFFLVNTFDFFISLLQIGVLIYYFRAWRDLAKEKAIDKYISVTFTCLALATFSRFFGTMIKCTTNFTVLITPGKMIE